MKMYLKDKSCDVDLRQIDDMTAAGWSKDKPEVEKEVVKAKETETPKKTKKRIVKKD